MNKERNKITQFVKDITELFKHNRYQDIYNKFENNPPDLNSFYSISARVKYIHSVVLRKISQSYQLWFQESSICLSPNYLPFIPTNYFDEWIETFYSIDKEGCEQWLPRDISLKSVKNENTFLKADASFSKKIVFEGDPAEIKVLIISTLPKEIRDASIAVQVLYKPTNEKDDNSNSNNYQNPEILMIAEHQSITPNKRLFFRSSVILADQSNNSTDVKITDVILIINSVKLIFDIESSFIKSSRSESPNSSKEIRIEAKDIGCSLAAKFLPPGFVDVPVPIHLKFSTSDLVGYSIILRVKCSKKDKKDTFISLNPDMSDEMETVTINVENPLIEYNQTFYAFSHIPKLINLKLYWYIQRNGKNSKTTKQKLPLEFHYPFILNTKIFNETSSCRTEVDIQKTPLLTESSYSILTNFTSNCPWPVTINSFEIIPENENQKEEEEYIKKRFLNANSDTIDTDAKNNNSYLIFRKPIINLPIVLETNDRFSAFTKFSTTKKEYTSTNLGTLLIRYLMHSTIYKGIHLYAIKLPSNENAIINKKVDLTPAHTASFKNIDNKISNANNNKKQLTKFNSKGNKNSFSRNSCNLPVSKNSNFNNNNLNTEEANNITTISIEKLKLHVEFDFPSRGSQFEMCELTIRLTNVSETPLEIVLEIKKSTTFLMSGTLSTQIGLFPYDPAELSLKFFPLAHGSLKFPKISIFSAQSYKNCYWSANPTIFISYPVAS